MGRVFTMSLVAAALASVVACRGAVESQTVNCTSYPTCDPGDDEIASSTGCLQDDARCYERSLCGATIWCTGPRTDNCAAYPSCDGNDKQVSGPSACLQDDATCYQRSLCGATIWCTGSATDAGPSPDSGADAGPKKDASPDAG